MPLELRSVLGCIIPITAMKLFKNYCIYLLSILGKFTLPARTSLVIPIHHLHRDPQYWEDPWTVKPERFLPENVKKRDPNAFVPFSLGPMDCLGKV